MAPEVSDSQTGIVNAMSIDVEDYFHASALAAAAPRARWSSLESSVVRNTHRVLGICADERVCGTFFVLGWVAERYPELVDEIVRAGHEVASHGYGHRLVYDLTRDEFRDDVRRAKALLEDRAGRAVLGYRAPSYSITERSRWALDILIEEGYRYDSSIFPILHDRYGIPDAPRHQYEWRGASGSLAELPPATVRVLGTNLPVAGGGYFRLLPYAWTAWGIRRVNRLERKPVVFYLHPWEFDPEQPRLPVGWVSQFRHYRNLHETEPRFRRLLREFTFGPMAAMLALETAA